MPVLPPVVFNASGVYNIPANATQVEVDVIGGGGPGQGGGAGDQGIGPINTGGELAGGGGGEGGYAQAVIKGPLAGGISGTLTVTIGAQSPSGGPGGVKTLGGPAHAGQAGVSGGNTTVVRTAGATFLCGANAAVSTAGGIPSVNAAFPGLISHVATAGANGTTVTAGNFQGANANTAGYPGAQGSGGQGSASGWNGGGPFFPNGGNNLALGGGGVGAHNANAGNASAPGAAGGASYGDNSFAGTLTAGNGADGTGVGQGGGGGGAAMINQLQAQPAIPTNGGNGGRGGPAQVVIIATVSSVRAAPSLAGIIPLSTVPLMIMVNHARPISLSGRYKA